MFLLRNKNSRAVGWGWQRYKNFDNWEVNNTNPAHLHINPKLFQFRFNFLQNLTAHCKEQSVALLQNRKTFSSTYNSRLVLHLPKYTLYIYQALKIHKTIQNRSIFVFRNTANSLRTKFESVFLSCFKKYILNWFLKYNKYKNSLVQVLQFTCVTAWIIRL